MQLHRAGLVFIAMGAAGLAGCGAEEPAGQGSVAFTTWGEGYIEQEIPASAFTDGWSVHYTRFLIVLGRVTIEDDAVGAQMQGTKLFNHAVKGTKALVTFNDLEAKAWPKVSYSITPAASDTEAAEGATADDVATMKAGGYSVYVEGEAVKGGEKKTFKWGFTETTRLVDCKGDKDGKETPGVIVTNGGTDTVELTVHGDHLFYDDLQSPDAKLRFNAIASADGDGDGEVTQAELAALKLVSIDPGDGGYGTGAADHINDLGAFIAGLSRTVGHYRGEGECFATDAAAGPK